MTFSEQFRVKTLDSILTDAEKPQYQLRRVLEPALQPTDSIGACSRFSRSLLCSRQGAGYSAPFGR